MAFVQQPAISRSQVVPVIQCRVVMFIQNQLPDRCVSLLQAFVRW